jgi:hypothetical protein
MVMNEENQMENVVNRSVTVEYSDEFKALWMSWGKGATGRDVQNAYREISAYLETQDEQICIVVDLRQNIYMPVRETVSGALFGPYKHPKVGAWLVMGGNSFAQHVAIMLQGVTKQNMVVWCNDEAEVFKYLEANCPRHK